MNKALLLSGSFISTMTAVAIGSVGEVSACGEVTSWTVPVTIFVTTTIPTVLAYFAGRKDRVSSPDLRASHDLRAKLIEMHAAFDAELPPTITSQFQLASHYYRLVVNAKPTLRAAIEKLGK